MNLQLNLVSRCAFVEQENELYRDDGFVLNVQDYVIIYVRVYFIAGIE